MDSELSHPPISGAHHMGFSVRNLERSIRFYCDVLGADLIREPYDGDSPSFSGRMAIVGLGVLGLDLIEHTANGGESFAPARTGLDHLAFPTGSIEELEEWASWLDACDISHSGVKGVAAVGGMLNFVDPDGIQLEFLFVDLEKLKQGVYASGWSRRSPHRSASWLTSLSSRLEIDGRKMTYEGLKSRCHKWHGDMTDIVDQQ